MDIKHLEFFCTVAHYGSINKAAQELYISQPHLSHIIRDMEADVGVPLFQRTKQGVTLTHEGQNFLEHAKVILKEMETLKQVSCRTEPEGDRLLISMTKFTHTMESFNEVCIGRQHLPRFTYLLNEGATLDVVSDVEERISDVGCIHFASHESQRLHNLLADKGLVLTPLATMPPHIVISKNHELLRQKRPVTLKNLRDYGFVRYIGQYEDFIYNISTEDHQTDLNNSSRIIYVYGRAALMHLIAVSNFYTIGIQGFSTQDSLYQCASIPIKHCKEQLEFGLVTRRDAALSDAEKEFVENVTARYRAL
ncbi:LysR family transcriptional regulator [Oscillibacter ruminantium]|uniref:LysR family transcriptional regulator n=1 Tax=Oscillibacter ruminantium TaxID=1263547 RepID=UPI003331B03D